MTRDQSHALQIVFVWLLLAAIYAYLSIWSTFKRVRE